MKFEHISSSGEIFSEALFGGNVLATWGTLTGPGSYDQAIQDLGVTTLRYPGGSLTEYFFDINNPDAAYATHNETGEVKSIIPISDFMGYAETNGHSVSIVLPTKDFLSEQTDELGHRLPDFDEAALRGFINDVVSGAYGNPHITAFEIGNEYWHSGEMDAVEYGRLAAEMAIVIDDELSQIAANVPEAAEIEITVQMGLNYGTSQMSGDYEGMSPADTLLSLNEDYGLSLDDSSLFNGGGVNWTYVNNALIINNFTSQAARDAIDGVIAHVYSLGESNEWSRTFELTEVEKSWLEVFPGLNVHVTEWNQKGVTPDLEKTQDYGLFQAEEMLNILEEFARVGVDNANVWPLIQNTDNTFSLGFTYQETNVPGAMFSMLAENLPGMLTLDFSHGSPRTTEAEFDGLSVHGFAGNNELLLYVFTEHQEGVFSTDLDLAGLMTGFQDMELTILGVQDGQAVGSNASTAELETLDYATVFQNGILDVNLDPGEVLQVKIMDPEASDALAPFLRSSGSAESGYAMQSIQVVCFPNAPFSNASANSAATKPEDEETSDHLDKTPNSDTLMLSDNAFTRDMASDIFVFNADDGRVSNVDSGDLANIAAIFGDDPIDLNTRHDPQNDFGTDSVDRADLDAGNDVIQTRAEYDPAFGRDGPDTFLFKADTNMTDVTDLAVSEEDLPDVNGKSSVSTTDLPLQDSSVRVIENFGVDGVTIPKDSSMSDQTDEDLIF